MKNKNVLSAGERDALLLTLRTRFEKHPGRRAEISWSEVDRRLSGAPGKLWSLAQMEETGGEPDVVGREAKTGEIVFFDCAPETPEGRRNVCYDREALDARKTFKPEDSAVEMATAMGATLLSEAEYRWLQERGEFDRKTSSWILTPPRIRKLGGALFGDRRYDTVFVYHNGASSYFSARAFRVALRV